jgi:FdhE protein
MPFPERDQRILADLRKAESLFRDLEEVLAFYGRLFRIQFAFKGRPEMREKAAYWENRAVDPRALDGGRPQIRFDELGLQPDSLRELYRDILNLSAPYVGAVGGPLPETSPGTIAEYAREVFIGQDPPVVSTAAGDLSKTAAGLALAPYLQLACEGLQPRIPANSWHREFCPVCGGKPCFAALTSDTAPRTLLCPRCHGEWAYGRIGCPFCHDRESQSYYPSEDGRYRLYVCAVCRRYLKTVDARERGQDLCLPVANLVTISMDLAAREKGYKS